MQESNSEILTVILASTAIILLLIVLVAFFILIYQRRVMAQKVKLQEVAAEAQRQKMAAIIDTQEAERMRIARDLHDEIGGMLSTVKMSLKLAERKLAKAGHADLALDEPVHQLDRSIAAVRDISHDLLPPSLESLGLGSALHALAQRLERLTGVPFAFEQAGEWPRLPLRQELALYRMVQELCTNSIKHAQARHRSLHLLATASALRIQFRDDGQGCDLATVRAKGLGLQGIESRAESLGGRIQWESAPSAGFGATIALPR